VATDPIDLDNDLEAAVLRARRAAEAVGELRPAVVGGYASPFPPEARDAVRRLLRDGTYHRAAAAVGASDPDLTDQ